MLIPLLFAYDFGLAVPRDNVHGIFIRDLLCIQQDDTRQHECEIAVHLRYRSFPV